MGSVACATLASTFDPSVLNNAAPGAQGSPVRNNESSELLPFGLGTVIHRVNPEAITLTNLTAGHIFDDGFIVRGVVEINGTVFVRTFGEGVNRPIGPAPGEGPSINPLRDGLNRASLILNNVIGPRLFMALDQNVRRDVLSRTPEGQGILFQERLDRIGDSNAFQ